jgi:hypothetical protein
MNVHVITKTLTDLNNAQELQVVMTYDIVNESLRVNSKTGKFAVIIPYEMGELNE